jgi:hypothetical protein
MDIDIMKAAFEDELRKIAAVRSGRRPISAHTLLAKKGKKKVSDIIKLSTLNKEAIPAKVLGTAALGALGTHAVLTAKKDWQRGREHRIQAQQAYSQQFA